MEQRQRHRALARWKRAQPQGASTNTMARGQCSAGSGWTIFGVPMVAHDGIPISKPANNIGLQGVKSSDFTWMFVFPLPSALTLHEPTLTQH